MTKAEAEKILLNNNYCLRHKIKKTIRHEDKEWGQTKRRYVYVCIDCEREDDERTHKKIQEALELLRTS